MLEENRDLLHDITNRECSREEAAQLPKILFDLMSQASDAGDLPTLKPEIDFESESVPSTSAVASIDSSSNVSSAQEILSNLPKVWKVLIELLNHQKIPPTQFTVIPNAHRTTPTDSFLQKYFLPFITACRRTPQVKIATNRLKRHRDHKWC